jgi:hypothetical protein
VLPALTIRRRTLPSRRVLLAGSSAALFLAAAATQLASAPVPVQQASLAAELRPSTWAMLIPTAWLAAPAPRLQRGDALDILAVRGGDRAGVLPVAYAVTVLSADERGLVLQVDENDASAIAAARGGGMLLVALLRSIR